MITWRPRETKVRGTVYEAERDGRKLYIRRHQCGGWQWLVEYPGEGSHSGISATLGLAKQQAARAI